MEYVSDLHLHSKYSRAVSKDMVLPIMAQFAKAKGIDILSTSDWTHPLWFKEISQQLEEKSEGLYGLKSETNLNQQNSNNQREPLFLLSVEIASIYSQGGKLRRIHNLVFAPNFTVAEKVSKELMRRGCNLMSDGRPIIGISSMNLLEILLGIDPRIMLIPCHVWTPHFGVYGSASGFDSLDEAFGNVSDYIYGIETGLSSDPEMNWQMRELENRSILSFSDAHSPAKMGREATVFVSKDNQSFGNKKITYEDIRLAIMKRSDTWKVGYTLEFYPEEGKYHFSGHRNCKVVFGPEEIRTQGTTCPVCKRKLTEGVLFRVQQLSDSRLLGRVEQKRNSQGLLWFTDNKKTHPPYVKLVPLNEIIAESLSSTVFSQKVKQCYASLCKDLGSEFTVLLRSPIKEITKVAGEKIAQGVEKVRQGSIVIDPGFDGEYGKVEIWHEAKNDKTQKAAGDRSQLGLF